MADSSDTAVYKAIRGILQAAQLTSLTYVKKVYDGVRDGVIARDAYPNIVLEPFETPEALATTDRRVILTMRFKILCNILVFKNDLQIVGDATHKGVMDFQNEVKNALMAYPDLNYDSTSPRLQHFKFPNTVYQNQFWPYRTAEITFEGTKLTTGGQSR